MVNASISISAVIVLLVGAGYALYKQRSLSGLFLFAALSVTAFIELFDLLSLIPVGDPVLWKKCAVVTEALLPSSWMLCSLTFARQQALRKIGLWQRVVLAVSSVFVLITLLTPLCDIYYAPDFPDERLLFLGNIGFFYYIGIMIILVIALVNFEVTFSNALPEDFWKIKFELLGLCTIVTVQIFYYSQALLYRSLNMNYLSLRSFIYLVSTALIGYSITFRRGNVRIQVSRQAAFKSVVLFAVGFYLIILGLLGEGMEHFGTFFPRTMTVSLAFLLGIGLLVLLLSEKFRREIKVVLHKNFYQQKHDYRTQWLSFTEQLSTSRSGEELIQRILSSYCSIFSVSGSALFLAENNRTGYYLQALNEMVLHENMIMPNNSLVRFMTKSSWVISIADENSEIAEEDLLFFRKSQISCVIPLFDLNRLEGFILLGPQVNSKEIFIYEDYDLMKTIARQATLAIMHQKLSEKIAHASEIQAIGNVATFVAHDLKNLVSNLSLIVENAAKYIHNPDFQKDMLISLGNTVDKMQSLISRLKNLGEQDHLKQFQVDLLELAETTAHMVMGKKISVSGTAEKVFIDKNEIQKVLLNLLMNSIEASEPDKPVAIEVGFSGAPFFRVIDQGAGISAHFMRTELFKPFRTTKEHGLGIGLYQCRQIVEAHGGRIEVSSKEGEGSVFTVWFDNSAVDRLTVQE